MFNYFALFSEMTERVAISVTTLSLVQVLPLMVVQVLAQVLAAAVCLAMAQSSESSPICTAHKFLWSAFSAFSLPE